APARVPNTQVEAPASGPPAAPGRPALVDVRRRVETPEPTHRAERLDSRQTPEPADAPAVSVGNAAPRAADPPRPPTSRRAPPPPPRQPPCVAVQLADEMGGRAEGATREGRTESPLRRDPPNLGTVRVHLSVSENTVTARLVVQEEGTRQLIVDQFPALRQK